MTNDDKQRQQIHAVNQCMSLAEALAARVKDPLWFLARQWQSGEFTAQNGGRMAGVQMETREFPLREMISRGGSAPLDPAHPLDAAIESESQDHVAPNWRSEALEYQCTVKSSAHSFEIQGYDGHGLDWFHLELSETGSGKSDAPRVIELVPTQLEFRGEPHPRWWRLEDAESYFDSPQDSEFSVLSTLLPEIFYTDVNNWFISPAPMTSGAVRQIVRLTVTDSFGVVTEIAPAADEDNWRVFCVDSPNSDQLSLDGSWLVALNAAVDVLHNDPIEDVRFARDESANLVWAVEQLYQDGDRNPVLHGDGQPRPLRQSSETEADMARFKLVSDTFAHWIPYLSMMPRDAQAQDEKTVLRRGRTIEAATPEAPQYKSQVVSESKHVNEEEIPFSGLRIRRINRFARGSDGSAHFWVGRLREAGRGAARSGLRFDYLEDDEAEG